MHCLYWFIIPSSLCCIHTAALDFPGAKDITDVPMTTVAVDIFDSLSNECLPEFQIQNFAFDCGLVTRVPQI